MSKSRLGSAYDVMPVGTVLPWAGDASQTGNLMLLLSSGWFPCDGSHFPVGQYPDLYAAIGTCHGGHAVNGVVTLFNIPNLNATYIRGVDPGGARDPDYLDRTAAAPGGCIGNEVGSEQAFATTAPSNPFATDTQGAHTHTVEPVTQSYRNAWGGGKFNMAHINGGGSTQSSTGGTHSHDITGGGDPETRPPSVCMSWIIRYLAASGEQLV